MDEAVVVAVVDMQYAGAIGSKIGMDEAVVVAAVGV